MKIFVKLSTILLFLAFSVSLFAQEVSKEKTVLETKGIYLQTKFFGPSYVKNGQVHKIGMFGKNIKKELVQTPEVMAEFKKFQRRQAIGLGLSVLGIGFTYGAIFHYLGKTNTSQVTDGEIRTFVIGTGFTLSSTLLGTYSYNPLQKAIFLSNAELAKQNK